VIRTIRRQVITASLLLISVVMLSSVGMAAEDSVRKVKTKTDPVYPALAKQMHLTGVVNLSVTIAPNGTVKAADVVGGSPVLAQAAVDAIKKWKFEPAAADTKQIIEFKFHE
jgi:TonB family protein